MLRVVFVVILLNFACLFPGLWAAEFDLPENGDNIIGHIQHHVLTGDTTLLDIARQYDMGINEIAAANPGVNPWIPNKDYRVVIPSLFVLPPKPWKGIIVNLPEMRLYYFPESTGNKNRRVVTMPLSIGKISWQTPRGRFSVKEKIIRPSWTVPQSIVDEHGLEKYGDRRILPPGDEDNPLGEFAILLNEPGYLIHGTNKPFSIGLRVSHGCIRLYPEDIEHLFKRVQRNVPVRIINQPNKVGRRAGTLYIEAHASLEEDLETTGLNFTPIIRDMVRQSRNQMFPPQTWRQLDHILSGASGLPIPLLDMPESEISVLEYSKNHEAVN